MRSSDIRLRDPNLVSPAVKALNPHLYPTAEAPAPKSQASQQAAQPKKGPRGRAPMNKTETAFSALLDARQRRGEILHWQREGITLRWPDGMTYSPDFSIVTSMAAEATETEAPSVRLTLIETKGGFIRDDALVKFRAARSAWPHYRFEMWQLTKGEWTRIL